MSLESVYRFFVKVTNIRFYEYSSSVSWANICG